MTKTLPVLTALALVLIAGGAWLLLGPENDGETGDGVHPGAARPGATAPGDSDEIFDPVTMEDVEQAQRNVVETAEVEAPEQVTTEDRPGPQQPVASLSGRCINGQGVALDGVKILDRDKRTVARSSDDGSFRFDVDLQDRQSLTRRFSFEREGSGRRELQVTLRAGQETSCGDV
ncbi:MAG: hypothetical protein ACI8PQ_001206, partial [Planctomycetota bacterium]